MLKSSALKSLFVQLDEWPRAFRSVETSGGLKNAQPLIEKALKKQIDRLHFAVDDTGFDRHELRIVVKQTRYLTEAFPKLSPLSPKATSSLKALQSALGSWHDHYQWCQKVLIESDLRPFEKVWRGCAETALHKAEAQLVDLAKLLPKTSDKKSWSK
ncbi:CHAD domain-containing protein [Pseudomonas sp. NPDC087342]|uniref:CHAD domain-containing protein n=1 Tax=Pseudomonas sp. NPDC087342 TaxID=3364437 RepID=UPI003801CD8B